MTGASVAALTSVPALEGEYIDAPVQQQYSTNSGATSLTLAAADIYGGAVEHTLNLTGAPTAAQNAQLPTVAALIAAIPNVVAGNSYKLRILGNGTSSGVWTVITNAGSGTWTLTGAMTIPVVNGGAGFRDFYVTVTNVTPGSLAATLQSLGTGNLLGAV